ncbi:hypothetical protein F4782DRAFT_509826 [Xylaria castorea]|nr:hypothetical protein F4782DRAFT_509826 [Xylaria castorea]
MESRNGNIHPDPNLSVYQALLEHQGRMNSGRNGSSQPSSSTQGGTGPVPQPHTHLAAGIHSTRPSGQIVSNANRTTNQGMALRQLQPLGLPARPEGTVYLQDQIQPRVSAADKALQVLLEKRLAAHNKEKEAGINKKNEAGQSEQNGSKNAKILVAADGIRRSLELHQSLNREGLTLPLTSEYLQAKGTKMAIIEIDHPSGNGSKMAIPFFPLLLRQTPCTPCCVCLTDVEFNPRLASWKLATRGFGAQWVLGLLTFVQAWELPECQHRMDVCRDCMANYIKAQVNGFGVGAVDNIKCPSLNCRHKLTLEEIGHFAPADTYRTYDELVMLRSLPEASDFRWCLRVGCGKGGFYTNGNLPLRAATILPHIPCVEGCITCPDCELAMCYYCQVPWHAGLTCAQHREKIAVESEATEAWLNKNTKRCPGKGCGVLIEVDGRRLQGTCGRCKMDFCWGCNETASRYQPRCHCVAKRRRKRNLGGFEE